MQWIFGHLTGSRVLMARMAQKPPNERGDFIPVHGHVRDAIPRMAKFPVVEISVAREEGGPALLQQQRNHFIVLHSAPTNVETNLTYAQTPVFK
jgi:hypothetical protein